MNRLINELIRFGYLKNDLIIEAFSEIDRVEFVPENLSSEASSDVALPIGYGQTISQPKTVAMMFELLEPQRNQNILDVGSGSGWTTALLCYIVGRRGRVTAVERIEKLKEYGENNVGKYSNYLRDGQDGMAEFHLGNGAEGFKKNAPYDRILVSASAREVPQELKDQLKIGGKMVIPVGESIWYLEKEAGDKFRKEEYPGFVFVPLADED